MAVGTESSAASMDTKPGGSYLLPMTLMVCLYFSIGFITALNDILVPHFKDLFHLTNVLALLVQFCFFGAYFVMSVPSGWVVGNIGYKGGIIAALTTMGIGLLLFVPASIVISYPLFLFALFVVGSGLALLQVAINPYVGALGKPETAAARLNLCGGLNSFATTIAPKLGATFIFVAAGATTAQLAPFGQIALRSDRRFYISRRIGHCLHPIAGGRRKARRWRIWILRSLGFYSLAVRRSCHLHLCRRRGRHR